MQKKMKDAPPPSRHPKKTTKPNQGTCTGAKKAVVAAAGSCGVLVSRIEPTCASVRDTAFILYTSLNYVRAHTTRLNAAHAFLPPGTTHKLSLVHPLSITQPSQRDRHHAHTTYLHILSTQKQRK